MVVASKPYQPGDQITVAKPFIYALIHKYKGHRCDGCFKPPAFETKLKNCSRCRQFWYCDQKCQLDDWFFHKYECPFLIKRPVLPLTDPTVPVNYTDDDLFWFYLRAYLLFNSKQSVASEKHRLFNGQEVAFQDLKTVQKFQPELEKRLIIYQMILQLIGEYQILFNWQNDFKFICRLTINLHPVGVPSPNRPDMLDTVGYAIWLETSLFQHSCTPSVFVKYEDNKMLMFAAKKIEVGEELTLAHLELDLCDETESRRRFLSNKNIDCECQRCDLLFDDNQIKYTEVYSFRFVSLEWQTFPFVRMQLGNDSNALTNFNQIYPHHHPEKTVLLVKLVKANAKLSPETFPNFSSQEKKFLFPEQEENKYDFSFASLPSKVSNTFAGFGTDEVVRKAIEAMKVTHPNDEVAKFDVDKSDVKEMTDYLVKYDKVK